MNRTDSVLVSFGLWLFVLHCKRSHLIYSWRTCVENANTVLLQMLLKIRLNMHVITSRRKWSFKSKIKIWRKIFFPAGELSPTCPLQGFWTFPEKQRILDYHSSLNNSEVLERSSSVILEWCSELSVMSRNYMPWINVWCIQVDDKNTLKCILYYLIIIINVQRPITSFCFTSNYSLYSVEEKSVST